MSKVSIVFPKREIDEIQYVSGFSDYTQPNYIAFFEVSASLSRAGPMSLIRAVLARAVSLLQSSFRFHAAKHRFWPMRPGQYG